MLRPLFFMREIGHRMRGVPLGDQVRGIFDELDGRHHPRENKNGDVWSPSTHPVNIWHRPQMVKVCPGERTEWQVYRPGAERHGGRTVRKSSPWWGIEHVEFSTLEGVDWYNNRRMLEPFGYVPPVEYEMNFKHNQGAEEKAA